jgi:hypothetical protein
LAVGVAAKFGGAIAKDFGVSLELTVGFKANNRFVLSFNRSSSRHGIQIAAMQQFGSIVALLWLAYPLRNIKFLM